MSKGLPKEIELGILCDPLSYQLRDSNIGKATLSQFDKDAEAVDRLLIRNLITGAMAGKLRDRILTRVVKEFKKQANGRLGKDSAAG
jgi:hypothetical protein